MIAGSVHGVRTMAPDPRLRRRCGCCGKRATHVGLGDGVALMTGCEWSVRLWIESPARQLAMVRRRRWLPPPGVARPAND